jgi:hypothetical protein
MILVPIVGPDTLSLNAYSYQNKELNIVRVFLTQGDFQFLSESIPADSEGRKGLTFILSGRHQISRLEIKLSISFHGVGPKTQVNFNQDGSGLPYCCIRLKHMPWEKGCADISATDDHAAFIKCALLANEKNWFGADSEPGLCKKL